MSSAPANIPPVEPWLAHLRRETERVADVVSQSALWAHAAAYPDSTVYSLPVHIARVLRLCHGVLAGDGEDYLAADAPDAEDVADWVLAALDPLITLPGEVPPDTTV